MTNVMSIEELLEEKKKIIEKMEIIKNDMSVYLDEWDFVVVLNESNPPVCYDDREYGYGYYLKGIEPEKFNEMFKEWAKETDPTDIPEYFNLKRKLYEIEAILDEREYYL